LVTFESTLLSAGLFLLQTRGTGFLIAFAAAARFIFLQVSHFHSLVILVGALGCDLMQVS